MSSHIAWQRVGRTGWRPGRPWGGSRSRNDEHPVLGQDPEFVRQTVLEMGPLKLLDELVAVDVVGGKAVLGGHKAQGGGQMGLAHTGRAEEYHVLPILQEAHGGQFVDLALVDGGLEGEIKVVQGVLHLEAFQVFPQPVRL